jgi:hypothetical protein
MPTNLMLDQPATDASPALRRFDFMRDSFAFINELVWAYDLNQATGKMTFGRRDPKPEYAHRCFAMARVARQFFYHARFAPEQSVATNQIYRQQVRAVIARSLHIPCKPEERIIISGFADLREFSRTHKKLLKAECGGAWRSYFLRSHWRMILPFSRAHQTCTAGSLVTALQTNLLPIVHIVKFPALTVNHAIVLFDVTETSHKLEFESYDPNNSERPERLTFDRTEQTFFLPLNSYWPGGALNVSHISRSRFF